MEEYEILDISMLVKWYNDLEPIVKVVKLWRSLIFNIFNENILDRVRLVVSKKALFSVVNVVRLGRSIHYININ